MYHRHLENGYDFSGPAHEQCKQQEEYHTRSQQTLVICSRLSKNEACAVSLHSVSHYAEFRDIFKLAMGYINLHSFPWLSAQTRHHTTEGNLYGTTLAQVQQSLHSTILGIRLKISAELQFTSLCWFLAKSPSVQSYTIGSQCPCAKKEE